MPSTSTVCRTSHGVWPRRNEVVDQPAADAQVGGGGDAPGKAGVEHGMEQVHVQALGEIGRQPGEQEVEGPVIGGKAEGGAQHPAIAEQVPEGRACVLAGCAFRLGVALADEAQFLRIQAAVLAGVAIDEPEGEEEQEAEPAGKAEGGAPAPMDGDNAQQRHADGGGEFGGGVEAGGGQAALPQREPIADGFGVGGKGRRLADAEQQPRGQKAVHPGRIGREERGQAPNEGGAAAHQLHSQPQEYGASFLNEPMGYAFNTYLNTYLSYDPAGTPAFELRVLPSVHYYVKSMVLSEERQPYSEDPTGFNFHFAGPVLAAEAGYVHDPPRAPHSTKTLGEEDFIRRSETGYYPGTYKFGGSYDPRSFTNQLTGQASHGNYVIWAQANQAVYREPGQGPGQHRGLDVTFTIDHSPNDVNQQNQQMDAGVLHRPLAGAALCARHAGRGLGAQFRRQQLPPRAASPGQGQICGGEPGGGELPGPCNAVAALPAHRRVHCEPQRRHRAPWRAGRRLPLHGDILTVARGGPGQGSDAMGGRMVAVSRPDRHASIDAPRGQAAFLRQNMTQYY